MRDPASVSRSVAPQAFACPTGIVFDAQSGAATCQLLSAGLEVFPAASVALTAKACGPGARPSRESGLEQAASGSSSTRHRNVAPLGSEELKRIVASDGFSAPLGAASMTA